MPVLTELAKFLVPGFPSPWQSQFMTTCPPRLWSPILLCLWLSVVSWFLTAHGFNLCPLWLVPSSRLLRLQHPSSTLSSPRPDQPSTTRAEPNFLLFPSTYNIVLQSKACWSFLYHLPPPLFFLTFWLILFLNYKIMILFWQQQEREPVKEK